MATWLFFSIGALLVALWAIGLVLGRVKDRGNQTALAVMGWMVFFALLVGAGAYLIPS